MHVHHWALENSTLTNETWIEQRAQRYSATSCSPHFYFYFYFHYSESNPTTSCCALQRTSSSPEIQLNRFTPASQHGHFKAERGQPAFRPRQFPITFDSEQNSPGTVPHRFYLPLRLASTAASSFAAAAFPDTLQPTARRSRPINFRTALPDHSSTRRIAGFAICCKRQSTHLELHVCPIAKLRSNGGTQLARWRSVCVTKMGLLIFVFGGWWATKTCMPVGFACVQVAIVYLLFFCKLSNISWQLFGFENYWADVTNMRSIYGL